VKTTLFLITFFLTNLFSLDLVERYLQGGDIEKAIDRLYFIAKDFRNFRCLKEDIICLSPIQIADTIAKIKTFTKGDEFQIADHFFVDKYIQKNIFIHSYINFISKHYQIALNDFSKILAIYPKNLYALKFRAKTFMFLENYSEAKKAFTDLVNKYPEISDPYFELIAIYIYQNDLEIAQKILNITKKGFQNDPRIKIYQEQINDKIPFYKKWFKYLIFWK
jgi:tetratricopeptide (TPR) repeat protein